MIDRGGIVRYAFVGSRQDKFPTHGEIMAAVAQL
jgi:hypothetical protein